MAIELTPRQQTFIDLYILNLNATEKRTQAELGIEAGYAEKSAYSSISTLLKNPKIQEAIQERFTVNGMSANEVLHHLADIARGTVKDSDLGSRLKALDLLAKHYNLTNNSNVDITSQGESIKMYVGVSPDDWDSDEK